MRLIEWLDRVTGTHQYLYIFLKTMAITIALIVSVVMVILCCIAPLAIAIATTPIHLLWYPISIPAMIVYFNFMFYHLNWD